jgi:hypothetical protein
MMTSTDFGTKIPERPMDVRSSLFDQSAMLSGRVAGM